MDDLNELDIGIYDIPDKLDVSDVKINPDYYIHTAILKAQSCLTKDDVKGGFLQYTIVVNHIEMLAKSAKKISDTYEDDLLNFKNSEDYKSETDKLIQQIKLCDKKLNLIMEKVFSKKTKTEPMQI